MERESATRRLSEIMKASENFNARTAGKTAAAHSAALQTKGLFAAIQLGCVR